MVYREVFNSVRLLVANEGEIPRHYLNALHRLRWHIQTQPIELDSIPSLLIGLCKNSLYQSTWKESLTKEAAAAILDADDFERLFGSASSEAQFKEKRWLLSVVQTSPTRGLAEA